MNMLNRSLPRLLAATGVAAMLPLVSCTGNESMAGPARQVSLAEFAAVGDQAAARPAQHDEFAPRDAAASSAGDPAAPEGLRLGAGTPPPEVEVQRAERDAQAIRPGRRVVVDSLVGQVNGRPIFADAFFEPIEDQLRALRQRAGGDRQFLAEAARVIDVHIFEMVRDELFLAEAESMLTLEQQKGLFAWMREVREQTIAAGGGTRTGADQRLLEQEGMSVEEFVRARRDIAIIRELIHRRIQPRVIVSWRDVQREYERRRSEFNPPARLKLARLRLDTADEAEEIDRVKQQLASGESFASIAESLGQQDGVLWQEFQLGPGGVEEIQLVDAVRERLLGLEPGQTSEPFQIGRSTWWLHVVGIEQPPERSLYDPEVQRAIRAELYQRRLNEAQTRYVQSLFEQGIHDELESMSARLLEIAAVRYGGLGR